MKKFILLIIVLAAAFAVYWFMFKKEGSGPDEPKQAPITAKKHSDKFNLSVSNAMSAYFGMQTAFVDADTLKAKESCRLFINLMDSIPLDELKADSAALLQNAQTSLGEVKANAESLLKQTDITEMRKDFSTISEMLYPNFFQSINYEGANLYWQNCPMAFGDDKGANWISNTQKIVNPYLGKNHPVYKGSMLGCGEIKDTIKTK